MRPEPPEPSTLAQVGEERLVAELTRRLPLGPQVRVAAGDDCAVIGEPGDRRWQLLKADAVVEGIHFLPNENARRVGWKALCRAVSDIAAMGGLPAEALITLAAAPAVELSWVRDLYSGLKKAARRFDISIVGGETSRSPGPLFINITLTGWVEPERCVLRSGGRPGDVLLVTGRLGGSIRGKHLDFLPRLQEARWLTEHFLPRAMMDLSDGLGADLPRLAAASHCGFHLESRRIPRTRGASLEAALGDGEDFELLLAVAPRETDALQGAWKKRFPKLPLTPIGVLTAPPAASRRPTASLLHGFDHFAQSR